MIFVSYSHEDREWCDALAKMASPLTRYGGIRLWSDNDISPGSNWRQKLNDALKATSVAVLLVSDSFLHSHFIQTRELPYFLAAAKERGVILLWILISDCMYEQTPLEAIEAALKIDKPLDQYPQSQRKTILKNFCKKIREAWILFERPQMDSTLIDRKVDRKEVGLGILGRTARRQTEVFVSVGDRTEWWHQGGIPIGNRSRTCYFGNDKTKSGSKFKVVAVTVDRPLRDLKSPMKNLPPHRTCSPEIIVVRR